MIAGVTIQFYGIPLVKLVVIKIENKLLFRICYEERGNSARSMPERSREPVRNRHRGTSAVDGLDASKDGQGEANGGTAGTLDGDHLTMGMARIARSNRLPDSLPVILAILEAHVEGVTIPALEAEIQAGMLWEPGDQQGPRAVYFRIYNVLKFLKSKGIVRKEGTDGREAMWILDRQEYERQRRKELSEVIRPFVDGCLMVSDPKQFVGQIHEMYEDGTMETMLAERRARGRRRS